MCVNASQVEENRSPEEYVFDHPNMARRALKNIALGMFCFNCIFALASDKLL